MTLEDHAGDIVRKARRMNGTALEAAAAAAGVSSGELEAFEGSGVARGGVKWDPLCQLLGLDAGALQRVMGGWVPEVPDLGGWRELRRISTEQEGLSVHCYLVWDEVTREAALFDTGWELEPIQVLVRENGLNLRHLFITHMHRDHVGALGPLREAYPKLLIHTNSKTAPVAHRNRANDFIHLGSLRITNRETPGHAEEGVTYVIGNFPEDAPNVALVGDAIFAGSMGGAPELGAIARQKVREQILSLPADTLIGAGHGPWTTVGQEKANNPFFRGGG